MVDVQDVSESADALQRDIEVVSARSDADGKALFTAHEDDQESAEEELDQLFQAADREHSTFENQPSVSFRSSKDGVTCETQPGWTICV